eukprot:m.34363 g.34363  ORF g.34363 m.34363 type:complete len:55 (+) comp9761_c0_seq1:225-389(+)
MKNRYAIAVQTIQNTSQYVRELTRHNARVTSHKPANGKVERDLLFRGDSSITSK